MYCTECGAQNADDNMFCESCGKKLIQPKSQNVPPVQAPVVSQMQPPVQAQRPTRQPMSKMMKIMLGELVALVICVIVFFVAGNNIFGTKNVAKQYFLKVMNADWTGVYNDLDLQDSEFLTKEMFLNSMKGQNASDVNTYEVNDSEGTSGISDTVRVSYRLKGNSNDDIMRVELSKQSGKKFLFFTSWKVDSSQYICKDFNIDVPKDATVKLAGITLGSQYKNDSDDDGDSYTIPAIFVGKYELEVSAQDMETVKKTISTSDGSYTLSGMQVASETQKTLINNAKEAMQRIYEAGVAQKDFTEIQGLFAKDSESEMQDSYNYFKEYAGNPDGTGIRNLTLSEVKGESSSNVDYDGIVHVYVTLSYKYNAKIGEKDWWDGTLSTSEQSNTDTSSFTYVQQDGKWVLSDASFRTFQ